MFPHGALECGDVLRRIVRVNVQLPPARLDFRAPGAKEFLIGAVDELDLANGIGDPHDGGGTVGHGAEALFAFAEPLLGLIAFGVVSEKSGGRDDVSGWVADGEAGYGHMNSASVRTLANALVVLQDLAVDHSIDKEGHAGHSIRGNEQGHILPDSLLRGEA